MTDWRERAACQDTGSLFFDRFRRHWALHICRYHCPVWASCNAEARGQLNIEVVLGGHAYGARGERLDKTEQALEVRYCNRMCGEVRERVAARDKQREA